MAAGPHTFESIDIHVTDGDAVAVFEPLTDGGRRWLASHCWADGHAEVVGTAAIDRLAASMTTDGLRLGWVTSV